MAAGRDLVERTGGTPLSTQQLRQARSARISRLSGYPVEVIDPSVDMVWGQTGGATSQSSYFDYFFTGEDIMLYIDGVEGFGCHHLPIISMGYNVQQKKLPVYGYASYTFDAVMRGVRMVTGQFTVATTTTDYVTNLISQAAEARMQRNTRYPIRGLDIDEENIERYWSRNIDSAAIGTKQIWSSHPPFNFVVVYGIQSTSVNNTYTGRQQATYDAYVDGTPILTDYNERLVESDPINGRNRMLLENIEISEMSVQYTPEGDVCAETYTFFGRDCNVT